MKHQSEERRLGARALVPDKPPPLPRSRRGKGEAGRGFTLLEVLISLGILAIVIVGLLSGNITATNANALSRRRSLMLQFAQSRMDQLITMTRTNIPIPTTTTITGCCSAMAAPSTGFDPTAAAGTGGWQLDVIDGAPPAGVGASGNNLGDDLMWGPLLAEGDASGVNTAATLSARSALYSSWTNGTDTGGCGSTLSGACGPSCTVKGNRTLFCREIHIEPLDYTAGTTDGGSPSTGTRVSLLRAWVRVTWEASPAFSVTLQEDIAQ